MLNLIKYNVSDIIVFNVNKKILLIKYLPSYLYK